MNHAKLAACSLVAMNCLVFGTTSSALGDQLTVQGLHYAGARVLGFVEGRLEFRTAVGETRQVDMAHVDVLLVERGEVFADFNQAERYASEKEWGNALLRYKRAARLSEGFWSEVIAARMLTAADRARRIDEAAAVYIRLVRAERAGPVAALAMFPVNIPTSRDAATTRALQQLHEAVAGVTDDQQQLTLNLLAYEILVGIRDPSAAQLGNRLTESEIPSALRSDRVYRAVLSALEMRLASDMSKEAFAALNRALTDCPVDALPDFLLLKGRVLLRQAHSREELIRASWAFLRVVTHMPEDARAAEGFLGAAKCLERLGRKDKATELLRECLALRAIPEATAKIAQEELLRLAKP